MKYYAIRVGAKPGIYTNWDEASKQVKRFKGAVYKSFYSRQEAESFMNAGNDLKNNENVDIEVYIDGSYSNDTGLIGSGIAIYTKDEILMYCLTPIKDLSDDARNVFGELSAAIEAIRIVKALGYKDSSIAIYYDYQGINNHANGLWETKTTSAKVYKYLYDKLKGDLKISFKHIKSHTGNDGNELADTLAKRAANFDYSLTSKNSTWNPVITDNCVSATLVDKRRR